MNFFSALSSQTQAILEKSLCNIPPSRSELLHLLSLDPYGMESDFLRSAAKSISRKRFGTKSMLLCQTGIESFPCSADCAFCNFGQSTFTQEVSRISNDALLLINNTLIHQKGAYAHFLLFMHTFDFSFMLDIVERTRKALPNNIDIVINCGDLEFTQVQELKSAGVSGAYHVLRLGEGKDTTIQPEERIKSIADLKKVGLDWYTCCEPIGPEHTNEEIIDQILLSSEYECFQNAVMRRICVPGSALASRGQIDLLRSAQIVAVLTLAMIGNKELSSIAIHEPDLLGLSSGANCIYAEFGVNPRDLATDTSDGRAYSLQDCKAMLHDVGYDSLMQAHGHTDLPIIL